MNKQIISFVMVAMLVIPLSSQVRAESIGDSIRESVKDTKQEIKQQVQETRKEVKDTKQEVRKEVKTETKNVRQTVAKLVNGEVTGKTDSSLTVSSEGKSYTVNVGSNTMIQRHFWGKSSLAEISVGNKVNVWGVFTDDAKTTIDARMIRDLSIMKRLGVFMGKVTSKTDNSLVLNAVARGNQTVTLTDSIKVLNRKGEIILRTDIQEGHTIRVRGMWDKSNNTITEVTEIKDFSLPAQQ